MAKPAAERNERIVRSSGNVFADLGFADADERQTKVRLAFAINEVLQRRGLPQGKLPSSWASTSPKSRRSQNIGRRASPLNA